GGRVRGVVPGIHSRDRDPAHGDRLGIADVLVRKCGNGVVVGEDISANTIVRQSYRGTCGAVVDLAITCSSDGQSLGSDIRHRGGGRVERVIAGVGAGDRDSDDVDRLAIADVLIGEVGGRVCVREGVSTHTVVRQVYAGAGGAAVWLVHTGGGNGQGSGGDVRRSGWLGEGVVAGGGATDAQA